MEEYELYRTAIPSAEDRREGAVDGPDTREAPEPEPRGSNLNGLLVGLGLFLLVGSIAGIQWGSAYVREHRFGEALGELLGHGSATYGLAENAMGIGAIGFIVGIVLVLIGLLHRSATPGASKPSASPVAAQRQGMGGTNRYCPYCGAAVGVVGAAFCDSCGARLQ